MTQSGHSMAIYGNQLLSKVGLIMKNKFKKAFVLASSILFLGKSLFIPSFDLIIFFDHFVDINQTPTSGPLF